MPSATWCREEACIPQWMSKLLSDPTPLQAVVWPLLRTNRDVVVIAEHGCGKTLAYAVPLLVRAAALQGPNFDGIKRFNCLRRPTNATACHGNYSLGLSPLPPKKILFGLAIFKTNPGPFTHGAAGSRHEQPDWCQQILPWQEWRQRPPDGVILVPTAEMVRQVLW